MNKNIKTATVFLVLMSLAFPASFASYTQGLDDVTRSIRTPDDLARWMSAELTYQLTLPDAPRSPQETLQTRCGDCDDFAKLASVILARMGIPSEVIIIRFKGLSIAHAICIWKEKNGLCSFISNKELQRTGEDSVEKVIRKFYPDYKAIEKADLT